MKKLIEIKKENKIRYAIIISLAFLFCQNFLQMHFSSDTYVLWDLGYMQYPQEYFLLDGRIISSLVCYAAGLLNLPLEVYIVGMNFFALIFVSLSICVISDVLIKLLKPKDVFNTALVCAMSFLLVLNQFSLEYQLFPESAVMCLGLFLITLAVKIYAFETKHKYKKVFALILIATICYQGLINIFPIYVLLIYIVRGITNSSDEKITKKAFFIDIAKLLLIAIVIVGISLALVELGTAIFDNTHDRTLSATSSDDVLYIFASVIVFTYNLWVENINMLPHHLNTIIFLITIVILMLIKQKKHITLQYVLFTLSILICCMLPMFMLDSGPAPRVNSPISMFIGASLVILYAYINIYKGKNENKLKIILYVLIISIFILNSMFLMRNITEHISSNKVEHTIGGILNDKVEKYEAETGITVEVFCPIYEQYQQATADNILHIGSLTEKKLGARWAILHAANYYCDKDFTLAYHSGTTIDYTEFSHEFIYFEDNIVYMIIH